MSQLHSLETFSEYPEDWDLSGIIIEELTVTGGACDLGDMPTAL